MALSAAEPEGMLLQRMVFRFGNCTDKILSIRRFLQRRQGACVRRTS